MDISIHLFSDSIDLFKIVSDNKDKNIYDLNSSFKSKTLGGEYFGVLVTQRGMVFDRDLVGFNLLEKLFALKEWKDIENFKINVLRNGREVVHRENIMSFSKIARSLSIMAFPYKLNTNDFEAWKAKKLQEYINKECLDIIKSKSSIKKVM